MNSTPNTSFSLGFFANVSGDPSGYGQGQTTLGGAIVTTDASGNASFSNVALPVGAVAGQILTAVASPLQGAGTSEFCAGFRIRLVGDLDGNGVVNFDDLIILAQHYGSSGTPDEGDINEDGRVDFSDLLMLAQDYGETLPASPAAGARATPAPSSVIDSVTNGRAGKRRQF